MFQDITQPCRVGGIDFLIPEDTYDKQSSKTKKLLDAHKTRMKKLKKQIDAAYDSLVEAHTFVNQEYSFSPGGDDAFEPGCHILRMGMNNDMLLRRIKSLKAESDLVFKEYS